jgi:predicted mannosyl-3-phosphoglycerate phosphatase (HAD superfamily)
MSKIMELADTYACANTHARSLTGMMKDRAALAAEVERMEAAHQRLLDDLSVAYREIKTEQRLSFRDQVGKLEAEIAALRKELHRVHIAEPLSNVNGIMARSAK